jgi:hypothetical protein
MSPMSKIPSVPDGHVIDPSGSPDASRGGLVVARLRGAARFTGFRFVATGFFFGAGLRGFAFDRFTLEAMPPAYAYSMSPFSMT